MPTRRENIKPVANLREFLIDFKQTNLLIDMEESSDAQLERAIDDSLDYINSAYPPLTSYSITGIPSWVVVRDRAVLNVLQSQMIKSARNQHSYADQGGVNIRDEDVYGRYVNLYNMLLAKNELHIQRFKTSINANAAYGGVESEYVDEYNDWY